MSKFADILGVFLNIFSVGDKTSSDKKIRFLSTYAHDLLAPSTLTGSRVWILPNQSGLISVSRIVSEQLSVTSQNVLTSLSFVPDVVGNVEIIVNGKSESTFSGAFSIASQVITWSVVSSGYTLETTYEVIARYTTAS